MLPALEEIVVLGTRFIANGFRDLIHQRNIESRRQTDRLREHGCRAGTSDAVQALVPPVVGRKIQTRNRRVVVLHQRGFFLQRQSRYQIGRPLLEAAGGVEIARRSGIGLLGIGRPRWRG